MKPELTCQNCGKKFYNYDRKRKFCSRECSSLSQKITFRGEGNPFYGRRHGEETLEKQSKIKLGKPNKSKGIKRPNVHWSDESRKTISERMKGRIVSVETREILRQQHLGAPCPEITKEKLSLYWSGRERPNRQGEKSQLWKGGITRPDLLFKHGIEFRVWRMAVFTRDNFTCQKCGGSNGFKLNAHHIQNYAQYPEQRIVLENGITLCLKCHRLFHRTYGIKNNTLAQLKQFLSTNLTCPSG